MHVRLSPHAAQRTGRERRDRWYERSLVHPQAQRPSWREARREHRDPHLTVNALGLTTPRAPSSPGLSVLRVPWRCVLSLRSAVSGSEVLSG